MRRRFFPHEADFHAAVTAASTRGVGDALPRHLLAVRNADGAVRSRGGLVYPPFTIVERSVTLQDWAATAAPRGAAEVLGMIEGVAAALRDVHAAGVVHRNLKPSNVLRLSGSGFWKLTGIGMASHAGAAPLPCCLLPCDWHLLPQTPAPTGSSAVLTAALRLAPAPTGTLCLALDLKVPGCPLPTASAACPLPSCSVSPALQQAAAVPAMNR